MLFPATPLFAGLWLFQFVDTMLICLSRSINEMKRLEEMSNIFQSSGVETHPPESKCPAGGNEKSEDKEEPWEMVMDKKHFKLWRRPITGTHLYQYRGEPCLLPLTVSRCPHSAFSFCFLNHSILDLLKKICQIFVFLSQMTSFSYSSLTHVVPALSCCFLALPHPSCRSSFWNIHRCDAPTVLQCSGEFIFSPDLELSGSMLV